MKNIYLVTGFLGSGKTTFIKNVISSLNKVKFALVINEFGVRNVDAKSFNESKIEIEEINNGSIFCSCKSNNLIEALIRLKDKDIKDIVIETSGFSDPRDMSKIMIILDKLAKNIFEYKGMITLVSANTLYKLIDSINAIKGQIVNSSVIVLNKIDISTKDQIQLTKEKIEEYNKEAIIYETSFSKVNVEEVLRDIKAVYIPGGFIPKTKNLGFRKNLLDVEYIVDYDKLLKLLKEYSKYFYRIKGFIKTTRGIYFIDCVIDEINLIKKDDYNLDKWYIILLGENTTNIIIRLEKALSNSQIASNCI